MKYQEPSPEEYINIAEKVRSGEYFREASAMYDSSVNDPMAERYLYIVLTCVGLLTALAAFYAAEALYPLSRSVPFVFAASNMVEEVPRIRSLKEYPGQTPNEAVLHFMVANFVKTYEEYSIKTLDRSLNGVQSQSNAKVFANYQVMMDPGNLNSPVMRYQRHSTRSVNVVSVKVLPRAPNQCEVTFDATVESQTNITKNRFAADMTFQFSGVAFDEKTGKVKPIEFQVMEYRTRRLQDAP